MGQVVSMKTGRLEPLGLSDETTEMKLYDLKSLVACQVFEAGGMLSFYLDATQAEATRNWLNEWLGTPPQPARIPER